MKTKESIFLKFFAGKNPKKEVKLKTPAQLTKVLEITRKLLNAHVYDKKVDNNMNIEEEKEYISKLMQIVNVLEMNKFEGLNRKVQLKPLKWDKDKDDKEIVKAAVFILKWGGELTHSGVN